MAAPHFAGIKVIASSLNPLMYSFLYSSLLTLSLLSFISAIYFLLKASRRGAAVYRQKLLSEPETKLQPGSSPSEISDVAHYQTLENNGTHIANSRLYELLLCDKEEESDWEGDQGVLAKKKKKRKNKRGKKKKSELIGGGNDESGGENLAMNLDG